MFRSVIYRTVAASCLLLLSVAGVSGEENLVESKSMSLDLALKAATAAVRSCRDQGYQVSVAVIERGGATQVILRDQLAGIFTPEVAVRKARTALNFRTNTGNLVQSTMSGKPASGLRQLPGAIFVGGGVRVEAGGLVVGAIGISGAPGPDLDEACAIACIDSIRDILDF